MVIGIAVLAAQAMSGHSDLYAHISTAAALVLSVAALALLWTVPGGKTQPDVSVQERLAALQAESLTDPVTGLGNVRSFQTELQREISRALRHDHTVALGLIEVDAFSDVTNSHGHVEGERILAETARALGGRRAEDRTFRLTGGEFGLILPYTTAREVYPLMESLRIEAERASGGSTVSIGVADLLNAGDSADDLRQRAEDALGEARRGGRNRVVAFAGSRPRQEAVPAPVS